MTGFSRFSNKILDQSRFINARQEFKLFTKENGREKESVI